MIHPDFWCSFLHNASALSGLASWRRLKPLQLFAPFTSASMLHLTFQLSGFAPPSPGATTWYQSHNYRIGNVGHPLCGNWLIQVWLGRASDWRFFILVTNSTPRPLDHNWSLSNHSIHTYCLGAHCTTFTLSLSLVIAAWRHFATTTHFHILLHITNPILFHHHTHLVNSKIITRPPYTWSTAPASFPSKFSGVHSESIKAFKISKWTADLFHKRHFGDRNW